ncbi:MAG: hypothetical protein WBQ60_01225, partial [Asticcacaulis sp.]
LESQAVYQVDPWAEHAPKSEPARVFSPLADLREGHSQTHLTLTGDGDFTRLSPSSSEAIGH